MWHLQHFEHFSQNKLDANYTLPITIYLWQLLIYFRKKLETDICNPFLAQTLAMTLLR